jgi:outer membrane murein-binding lipoprotein Lpp
MEAHMVLAAIIFVSIILMAIFIGVTIAGGKSHDRANEIASRRASELGDRTSADKDHDNG